MKDKYQTCGFSTTCDSPTDTISDCLNVDLYNGRNVIVVVVFYWYYYYRLEEPILEILYGAKTVYTRSAITTPKVMKSGTV